MNSSIDPYYLWLGIPPGVQPPHHYRLLGLSAFERDLDVIENASQLRTHFLRRQLHGPHGDLARRMLKEIDHATDVLLDPSQRDAYDQHMLQQAERLGRPIDDFCLPAQVQPRPILPPHLAQNAVGTTPAAAIPPALPSRQSDGTSSEDRLQANGVSSSSMEFRGKSPIRERRRSRGWQVGLLVLLMFLPAHGLLLWIGYRIAFRQGNESPQEVESPEFQIESPGTAAPTSGLARWPKYGIAIQVGEAATWKEVSDWLDWQEDWTIELWVQRKLKAGFQPFVGMLPPKRSGDNRWQGWVLGVESTELGREQLVLRVNGRSSPQFAASDLSGSPGDFVHVSLVSRSQAVTIFWDGKRIGEVPLQQFTDNIPAQANLWLGNAASLTPAGALDGHVRGLRVSSVARYSKPFKPLKNWLPDESTQLLPDLETRRANSNQDPQPVIDRSGQGRRGTLEGSHWFEWGES
jgi:hypothetical protein